MPHHRQAGLGEEPLHHVLVHARSRAQHARAHVGDAGQLKQSLDRAVLAEGPVQHGKDHVQRLAAQGRVAVHGGDCGGLGWFRGEQRGLALGQSTRARRGRRIAGPQLLFRRRQPRRFRAVAFQ